jgi:UDP-glucose 4-epimerase
VSGHPAKAATGDGGGIHVGGGHGFIGRAVRRALAAAHAPGEPTTAPAPPLAFGRGEPPSRGAILVWAGGTRSSDAEELELGHVVSPVRAIERMEGLRRVVYLSSAEVYGDGPVPFAEDQSPRPLTAYARAKLAGEAAVTRACAAREIELVILRPGVVYGPEQRPGMFVPACVRALRLGERFAVSGDGAQTRDFMAVADLAALVVRAATPGAQVGLFNAGTGRELAVVDAGRILARALGVDPGLVVAGERPPRPQDQRRYVLAVARARAAYGFEARTSFEAGALALAAALEAPAAAPSAPGT